MHFQTGIDQALSPAAPNPKQDEPLSSVIAGAHIEANSALQLARGLHAALAGPEMPRLRECPNPDSTLMNYDVAEVLRLMELGVSELVDASALMREHFDYSLESCFEFMRGEQRNSAVRLWSRAIDESERVNNRKIEVEKLFGDRDELRRLMAASVLAIKSCSFLEKAVTSGRDDVTNILLRELALNAQLGKESGIGEVINSIVQTRTSLTTLLERLSNLMKSTDSILHINEVRGVASTLRNGSIAVLVAHDSGWRMGELMSISKSLKPLSWAICLVFEGTGIWRIALKRFAKTLSERAKIAEYILGCGTPP